MKISMPWTYHILTHLCFLLASLLNIPFAINLLFTEGCDKTFLPSYLVVFSIRRLLQLSGAYPCRYLNRGNIRIFPWPIKLTQIIYKGLVWVTFQKITRKIPCILITLFILNNFLDLEASQLPVAWVGVLVKILMKMNHVFYILMHITQAAFSLLFWY